MKIGVALPMAESDGPGRAHSWPEIRDFAQAAESAGVDSLWVWDHFYYDPEDGSSIEGQHEAWTLLSAVAAITQRVELGTLVLCSTFRNPSLTAKMAATLDEVSGGRLILGIGAGWHDPEYDSFGFPKDHRVDRFEESLQILIPLLDGEHVTFDGKYHRAQNAFLTPPPGRRIPVLIACEGPRMLGLTARFGQAWNTCWYGSPDERLRKQFAAMDAAAVTAGRDPGEVEKTVGVLIRDPGLPPDDDEPALTGSVEDVAQAFDEYAALGVGHLACSLVPANEASLEKLRAAMELRR